MPGEEKSHSIIYNLDHRVLRVFSSKPFINSILQWMLAMECHRMIPGWVLYSHPELQGGSYLELLGHSKMLFCVWRHLKAALTAENVSSWVWEQWPS